ncbi:Opsin-5 [Cichlidogyrus casuarinus]|uniref:Opsin-5 n=1 Tax=Cichlidogyrus casuarinus TaxID=1844966 RepID=A0ABD2QFB2_9PLAT
MCGVPFAALSCFSGGKWIFGARSCELRAAEAMFTGLCFLMNLYICCMDRYLMIKYESWYVKNGLKVMVPTMLCTCLSAAVVAMLPLYGIGSYGPEPQGTSCLVDVSKHDRGTVIYILALAAFTFILPILIGFFSLLGAHFGLSKQNKAADKLKQMNKLVASLFLFASLGWIPFVYIYVSLIIKESIKYPLYVAYLGPICCKVAISILPIFYWIFLAGSSDGKSLIKPKIVYTKSGRAKKIE